MNFYERSRRIRSFVAARPPTGLRFRQPQDPAAGEAGLRLVPHIDDARIHSRGQLWADGRAVRPLRAYSCCCQLYLNDFPFLTKHGASARLSGIHDPRRNHVRPHGILSDLCRRSDNIPTRGQRPRISLSASAENFTVCRRKTISLREAEFHFPAGEAYYTPIPKKINLFSKKH